MFSEKVKLGAIISVFTVLVAFIVAIMAFEKVSPGYVGVVYSTNGGVTGEVKSQGWHLMKPFQKVMEYPISTETVYLTSDEDGSEDRTIMVSTRDGKPVKMGIAYSYKMVDTKAPDIYTKFRGRNTTEIQNGFMQDRLYKVVQEVVSKEGVLEVYGDKRSDINTKVFNAFREELEPEGIVIESFNFTEIIPDEDTMKAIQATVDAQQELKLIEVEQRKAEAEAERRRIEEEGYAKVRLIRAESEAKANRIVSESITNNLIKYKEIEGNQLSG